MRKSDLLIKIVTLIVFIAIVAYIGYSVYEARSNPLKTVLAANWEISNSVATEGYAVRDEQVMTYSGENVYISVPDGGKVAAGEAVAVSYSGGEALERAERMREISLKIDQLNAVKNGEFRFTDGGASVLALAEVTAGGDLGDLDEAALNIETNVFSNARKYTKEELAAQIGQLEDELDTLAMQSGSDTEDLCVTRPGTFSSYVDGYEKIGPESVKDIAPEDLSGLFAQPDAVDKDAFGKLISGIAWYYVTTMDSESAGKLKDGGKATLDFSKTYDASLAMTVEYVGAEAVGRCVVVFSCRECMRDIVSLRKLTADVIFSRMSGIRVPKEAVRLDKDGKPFVYVLVGMQAEQSYVEITAESGQHYLVTPQDGLLSEGSQIITKANGLFSGKVVG